MKTLTAAAGLIIASAVPAFADETALPPWNIGGHDWICIQQCATGYFGRTTEVVQNGRRFVFIDEIGRREQAEWMGDNQISFTGCDNNAILSADGKRLEFIFGSVWVR